MLNSQIKKIKRIKKYIINIIFMFELDSAMDKSIL